MHSVILIKSLSSLSSTSGSMISSVSYTTLAVLCLVVHISSVCGTAEVVRCLSVPRTFQARAGRRYVIQMDYPPTYPAKASIANKCYRPRTIIGEQGIGNQGAQARARLTFWQGGGAGLFLHARQLLK